MGENKLTIKMVHFAILIGICSMVYNTYLFISGGEANFYIWFLDILGILIFFKCLEKLQPESKGEDGERDSSLA